MAITFSQTFAISLRKMQSFHVARWPAGVKPGRVPRRTSKKVNRFNKLFFSQSWEKTDQPVPYQQQLAGRGCKYPGCNWSSWLFDPKRQSACPVKILCCVNLSFPGVKAQSPCTEGEEEVEDWTRPTRVLLNAKELYLQAILVEVLCVVVFNGDIELRLQACQAIKGVRPGQGLEN